MSIVCSKARWALPHSFAPDPPRASQVWSHFLPYIPNPGGTPIDKPYRHKEGAPNRDTFTCCLCYKFKRNIFLRRPRCLDCSMMINYFGLYIPLVRKYLQSNIIQVSHEV